MAFKQKKLYRVELSIGHSNSAGDLPEESIALAESVGLLSLAYLYGGGQAERKQGSYKTNDGQLVRESCSVIWAWHDSPPDGRAWTLAENLGKMLGQESVLLVITEHYGAMHFIPVPALPEPLER